MTSLSEENDTERGGEGNSGDEGSSSNSCNDTRGVANFQITGYPSKGLMKSGETLLSSHGLAGRAQEGSMQAGDDHW
jgi:hypothetical protein